MIFKDSCNQNHPVILWRSITGKHTECVGLDIQTTQQLPLKAWSPQLVAPGHARPSEVHKPVTVTDATAHNNIDRHGHCVPLQYMWWGAQDAAVSCTEKHRQVGHPQPYTFCLIVNYSSGLTNRDIHTPVSQTTWPICWLVWIGIY